MKIGDMVVVFQDRDDGFGKYKTKPGSFGVVTEIVQLTTRKNYVIDFINIVNAKGEVINSSILSEDERILEVRENDIRPMNKEVFIPTIGDVVKLTSNKSIYIVSNVVDEIVTVRDYLTGKECNVSVYTIEKKVSTPKLDKQWIIKSSVAHPDMWLCSHRKYKKFARKYIPKENFVMHHHELFTWFKEKKDKLVRKNQFIAGSFLKKDINEKTYYVGGKKATTKFTNIHFESEWFAQLMANKYVSLLINKYSDQFLPTTTDHYLGIEIECITKLKHEDLALELAKKRLHHNIRLTTDSSIQVTESGYYAVELRVLCKETELVKVLKNTLDVLLNDKCKAKINNSCGIHVHFDMRNRPVKSIYERLWFFQFLVKQMLPKHRRTNKYCNTKVSPCFEEQSVNFHHYDGISLSAYNKQKTLEIRFHEGSLSFDDIHGWIKFWLDLINLDVEVDRVYRRMEVFVKDFPSFASIPYMEKRIEMFAEKKTSDGITF